MALAPADGSNVQRSCWEMWWLASLNRSSKFIARCRPQIGTRDRRFTQIHHGPCVTLIDFVHLCACYLYHIMNIMMSTCMRDSRCIHRFSTYSLCGVCVCVWVCVGVCGCVCVCLCVCLCVSVGGCVCVCVDLSCMRHVKKN